MCIRAHACACVRMRAHACAFVRICAHRYASPHQVYTNIVVYKTAFYTFYLPIALGMRVAGLSDPTLYDKARHICVLMGEYFQVHCTHMYLTHILSDSSWPVVGGCGLAQAVDGHGREAFAA